MTDPTSAESAPAHQPRRQHGVWFWLRAVVLICVIPVIFGVVFALAMIGRDIAAPAWVKSEVSARAAEVLGGGTVEFGSIYLRIGDDLHPRVTLSNTVLRDSSGTVVARVPELAALVSPRGLVLSRKLLLQEIDADGMQVNLRRAADGSVDLNFDQNAGVAGQAPSLLALLAQSDAALEKPGLAALEQVHVRGLVVNYDDARAGRSWTLDDGQVSLDLRGDVTAINGTFAILGGGADITTFALNYDSPRGSLAANVALNVNDARASDIAGQLPALRWLVEVDAPITLALRSGLDSAGTLQPLSATLELGAGVLQPNAQTEPVPFQSAKAYLTYHPADGRITFDSADVVADGLSLHAQGQAFLRDMDAGFPRAIVGQFTFDNVVIDQPALFDAPLTLAGVQVDAQLHLAPFSLELGQVYLDDPALPVLAKGRVDAGPDGWDIAVDLAARDVGLARLMTVWPATYKPGTRQWFADNLHQGRIFDLAGGFRKAGGQPGRLALGFDFEQTDLTFMKYMPQLTGAAGHVSIAQNAMVLTLEAGQVTAPQGGALQMAGSAMAIPDLRIKGAPAVFDLAIDSTVTAALSILDQKPFEYLQKAGRQVTLADGRAQLAGQIRLPLRPGLQPGDVAFDFEGRLRDLRSATLVPNRLLTAAALDVAVDNTGLAISGPMQLDNVRATGRYAQLFGPENAGQSRVTADIALSAATLAAFGVSLPPGSVSGAGTGALDLSLVRGQAPQFTLTSDLRGIGLALTAVGWAKPENAAGALRVAGRLGAVPQVDTLNISGGGLDAAGSVVIKPDGTLDRVQFDQVVLGDWLRAPITLRGRGKGQPVGVDIAGGTLDLRRAQFGSGGGAQSGPMQIRLDRLQVTEGITLRDFRGEFTGTAGFSGQFTGNLNDGPQVRGTVVPQNGRSAVRLVSDDAGGVLRAAGLLRNAVGGSLDLTLSPLAAAGTFDGLLKMRGMRLQDAPTLAALLDAISVVGLLQQLDGQGMAFDEVDARFRLTPRQITVAEASAVGPGLGISLDGLYTLATKQFDFQGVVSPFYLVNSIGSVLTRKGEGLIGFNFTVAGTPDAPQVGVNPLSIFTPGMFREIFRRPVPELNQ